jgi:hypothetical protein
LRDFLFEDLAADRVQQDAAVTWLYAGSFSIIVRAARIAES